MGRGHRGPGAAADPSGIGNLAPTAPTGGTGKGNAPPIPCWGLSQVLGAPVLGPPSSIPFHKGLGRGPCRGRTLLIHILDLPKIVLFVLKTSPQSCPSCPRAGQEWEDSPWSRRQGQPVPFPLFIATATAEMTKIQGEPEQSCLIPPAAGDSMRAGVPQGFLQSWDPQGAEHAQGLGAEEPMRAPKGLEDPQKLGSPGDCRPQQEAEHPWGFGESQELDPHRELSSPRDVGIS